MSWLDEPDKEVWTERQIWFETLFESHLERCGSCLISEQASALCGDVEIAFCAGAWIAVIILAVAVIDSQLRETVSTGFKQNTEELFKLLGQNPKLQQLRIKRNKLVHIDVANPAITVDQQWLNQTQLEMEARDAIELMFEAFFSYPSI